MTTQLRSAIGRFVGVAADAQTYRNLAYLLLTFPLGILYLTAIWGGGLAGVSMIPILVGVPVVVAVLAFAAVLADFEARLTRGLLDVPVAYDVPRPDDEPITEYAKRLVFDADTYVAVVYLLSKFVLGVAVFVGVTVSASLAVTMALAPVLYDLPGISYNLWVYQIETLPSALGASAVGVLLGFVALHAFNAAAWVLGQYAAAMLGEEEDGASE
jgi:hypothetical protein